MLLACLDLLDVVEEHEHNSCDLLLGVVVHDLGHLLNDSEGIILKEWVSEIVIAEDPKHAKDVVAHLIGGEALGLEQIGNHVEGSLRGEFFGKLVGLQDSQKGEGVCWNGKGHLFGITLLNEIMEEFLSWLLALAEAFLPV